MSCSLVIFKDYLGMVLLPWSIRDTLKIKLVKSRLTSCTLLDPLVVSNRLTRCKKPLTIDVALCSNYDKLCIKNFTDIKYSKYTMHCNNYFLNLCGVVAVAIN